MGELKMQLPPEIPVEEAQLLLTIKLFEIGRLSLGQAAKLSGYSKREFMEVLGKHSVQVFDYSADELHQETSRIAGEDISS